MRAPGLLPVLLGAALAVFDACGRPGDGGDPAPKTDTSIATQTATATATANTGPLTELPPEGGNAVLAWLAAGLYRAWPCEAEAHGPRHGSPHGRTRICSNAALSAFDGPGAYPTGSATVKEVLEPDGSVGTYAVMLKVGDGSEAKSWYFFEGRPGLVLADGREAPACIGCHVDAGSQDDRPGRDYVYTQIKR